MVYCIAVVAERGGFKLLSGLINIIHCYECCPCPQMISNCRATSHKSCLVKACSPNIKDVTFYCLNIHFQNIFYILLCFNLCHTGEYPSVSKQDISHKQSPNKICFEVSSPIIAAKWVPKCAWLMVSHHGDLHDLT